MTLPTLRSNGQWATLFGPLSNLVLYAFKPHMIWAYIPHDQVAYVATARPNPSAPAPEFDMKKEADVKEAVKKILRSFGHNVWWFMPVPNGYGVQGVPDFICSVRGRTVAIETKFGDNELTQYQVKQMKAIIDSGAAHMVINETNVQHVEAIITGIMALEGTDASSA